MAESRDGLVNNVNAQKQSVVLGHKDPREENKTDAVMEPMLIEDFKNGNIPLSYQKVHEAALEKGIVLNKNDELIMLLHILMLESGFVQFTGEADTDDSSIDFHYRKFLNAVSKIPDTWKKSNIHYNLFYVLAPFTQNICKLVCSANGDDLLVNCIVENIDEAYYCMLIDPSLYIMTSTTKLCNKFQNMAHLSCTFKTTISNKAKVTILKHNNANAVCLEEIPPEVLMNIMQNFSPRTLAMFELTCVYFRKVSNDPMLWKKIKGAKYDTFQKFKRAEITKLQLGNAKFKYV